MADLLRPQEQRTSVYKERSQLTAHTGSVDTETSSNTPRPLVSQERVGLKLLFQINAIKLYRKH